MITEDDVHELQATVKRQASEIRNLRAEVKASELELEHASARQGPVEDALYALVAAVEASPWYQHLDQHAPETVEDVLAFRAVRKALAMAWGAMSR